MQHGRFLHTAPATIADHALGRRPRTPPTTPSRCHSHHRPRARPLAKAHHRPRPAAGHGHHRPRPVAADQLSGSLLTSSPGSLLASVEEFSTQRESWVVLPGFNAQGFLPSGIHEATWQEIEQVFGFSPRRKHLLQGLKRVLAALHIAGCHRAYLDGSFMARTGKRRQDRTRCRRLPPSAIWPSYDVSLPPALDIASAELVPGGADTTATQRDGKRCRDKVGLETRRMRRLMHTVARRARTLRLVRRFRALRT